MMTFNELRDKWSRINICPGSNAMTRVDNSHPLDIYIGLDSLQQLQIMLITEQEPNSLPNSRAIYVTIGKRQDEKWAVCFALIESGMKEQFIHLCWDLIESSRNQGKNQANIDYLLNRFLKWQRLLQLGHEGLLSGPAIKGLLGELIFLEIHAFELYDKITAIQGWVGPEKLDRDFVYSDRWYEIKAVDPSASEISISSIEQLDVDLTGHLVVCFLEKTSREDDSGVSLTKQVKKIRDILQNDLGALTLFENKLLYAGYIDHQNYEKYVFSFRNIRNFEVNASFPRLRRETIPPEIQKVSYTLSLAAIKDWELV